MKIRCNAKTHVGAVRSINQDSIYWDESEGLFIVADGMGGHAGGEIASKLCIEIISDRLKGLPKEIFLEDAGVSLVLSNAINEASTKIFERALEDSDLKGMGTTASVLKLAEGKAFCGHVGDSRLYLCRAGFIYQITNDHSLVSEQLHAGVISEEEAENHHLKNVITRSVGYQEEEHVDFFSFELEKEDKILLCSDGLHNKISDQELSRLICEKSCDSIDQLIDMANVRGGEDNISAIIVDVLEIEPQQ